MYLLEIKKYILKLYFLQQCNGCYQSWLRQNFKQLSMYNEIFSTVQLIHGVVKSIEIEFAIPQKCIDIVTTISCLLFSKISAIFINGRSAISLIR